MAADTNRLGAPELEQFVVTVQSTGVTIGAGAYGSVEEVEIPGARIAAKKLNSQLINLDSPQQVIIIIHTVHVDTIIQRYASLCLMMSIR